MNIGAAELVKRSASQLLYQILNNIKREVTPGQIEGDKHSQEVVKQESGYFEKRGIIPLGEDTLFFCIDMVKENKLIEIKHLRDENTYDSWYLEMSIMQSCFYATMATKVKTLDTPDFLKVNGVPNEIIDVPKPFEFELWFGNKRKYKIAPNEKVYNHYLNKIDIIKKGVLSKTYSGCKLFDAVYKFKEYSIYKPSHVYFDYR